MLGLEDKIKLSPINGALEIKNWDDFKNNYAFVLSSEISYHQIDGTDIILGFQ
jgi:hypothetical protein